MNAIILGAGLGTRLRPLTNDRPKCMVAVNGEPMIERQIRFLKQAGIDDITIVSGYKEECLFYLKEKYGVNIIFNPLYDKVNNIYSMYVAQEKLGDTYVLEGDVYIHHNFIDPNIIESTYFAVNKEYQNEWGLEVDDSNILKKVNVGDGVGFIMSGVSYWTNKDSQIIVDRINHIIKNEDYTNLFWDNAVIDLLDRLSPVKVKEIDGMYEIDTPQELANVELLLKSLN